VLGEITEPAAIRVVLQTLGMQTEPPKRARARDHTDMFDEHTGV